ncbi:MAG TPA: type II toxin-antitoxin system VapC family toxin [Tepidisphaeraceae bacterium]|nr:type II toxin-antitoxin system VapC family toxin [Tepidisphaeraceae bacterium]
MAYWDTSCLAKLYAPETDSADLKARVIGGTSIITSEIARLEIWTTLCRKEAVGDLIAGGARRGLQAFDQDVATGMIGVETLHTAVVEKFENIVERCYSQVPALALRTLDAIHLASAMVAGESEMITTDKRLRDAALQFGFQTYPRQ